MVTVSKAIQRQNAEGKDFIALELTGDLELIKSSESGNYYATAKKCTITSTFTEEVAKKMIGKSLPGSIEKVPCEPYEYVIKDTGETTTLNFTYRYNPNPNSTEEAVMGESVMALSH